METIVNWSATAAHIEGAIWRVTVTGEIAPEYHIYDTAEYEYGANPTIITVDGGNAAHAVGELNTLCTVDRQFDETLGFELGTISGTASFSQDVELSGKGADLEVYVEWMACTETACTPLDDTTLTVHIGEPGGHSPAYYAGYVCGLAFGIALVLLAHRWKKRNSK